jgi:hypothetical protein
MTGLYGTSTNGMVVIVLALFEMQTKKDFRRRVIDTICGFLLCYEADYFNEDVHNVFICVYRKHLFLPFL